MFRPGCFLHQTSVGLIHSCQHITKMGCDNVKQGFRVHEAVSCGLFKAKDAVHTVRLKLTTKKQNCICYLVWGKIVIFYREI